MAITEEKKKELITQYQKHKKDTGSPEVQISLVTERINDLTNHLNSNPKDFQSRCGLFKLVGKRKKQLNYLEKTNLEAFRRIIDQLAVRSSV